jgi:hypothetical protein
MVWGASSFVAAGSPALPAGPQAAAESKKRRAKINKNRCRFINLTPKV